LEEILILIIQFFFEVLINIGLHIPFESSSKKRSSQEPEAIWPWCILLFFGGCFLGWISLLIFKHTYIPTPFLRIASMLVSPILAAFLSKFIAIGRSQINQVIIPRNHFWRAFWLTLGFTVVRFAYATHLTS
jgi:hypothetical protein